MVDGGDFQGGPGPEEDRLVGEELHQDVGCDGRGYSDRAQQTVSGGAVDRASCREDVEVCNGAGR